jgi:hypothetical protein
MEVRDSIRETVSRFPMMDRTVLRNLNLSCWRVLPLLEDFLAARLSWEASDTGLTLIN